MGYETLVTESRGSVGLITFNRPKALNALNAQLVTELGQVLAEMEADEAVRAIVITGTEKAFAAGADIKEMQAKTMVEAYKEDFITRNWEAIPKCRKPVIAAVAGYALGGGCEVAMMCDIIIASDTAKFGQPEITIGVIPGAGGTQRLTRAIGKAKAMEMILTGRLMDAAEAERAGLVARVAPAAEVLDEALKLAARIGQFSLPSVMMAKEAVNKAYEMTLAEGVRYERRLFHMSFGAEDQKEGMVAFVEKRSPAFKDQ